MMDRGIPAAKETSLVGAVFGVQLFSKWFQYAMRLEDNENCICYFFVTGRIEDFQ